MEDKKYRLGNQSREYELITKYLGWLPEGISDWHDWVWETYFKSSTSGTELTIVSPDQKQKVTLKMKQFIIKDAFPLSFYGEERAQGWHRFYIVSLLETPLELFIIPLH